MAKAVGRARERGAEALQTFSSNPRGWALPAGDPVEEQRGREALAEAGFPLFLHAPYLVNLASPEPLTRSRSLASAAYALRRGANLGAGGVVIHAGHCVGTSRTEALARLEESLRELLELAHGVDVVVELTAGGRGAVACRPPEAQEILEAVDGAAGLRFCLDTCHLWAAGVDWGSPRGRAELAAGLAALGPGRVALVHVNDSADPLGSRRDRHRNLGRGTVPLDALPRLLAVPALAGAVLVTETPGTAADQAADVAVVRRAARKSRSSRLSA